MVTPTIMTPTIVKPAAVTPALGTPVLGAPDIATPATATRGRAAGKIGLLRDGAGLSEVTVLLADAQVLFRAGMRQLLPALGAGVDIVEAGHVEALMAALERAPAIDLLLIDPTSPGMGGTAALQAIRAAHPDLPVVVLSASEEKPAIDRALMLGARGYITKTTPGELTLAALRLVLSGGIYVPATFLAQHMAASDTPSHAAIAGAASLTPRQREVLDLLARGCPNKEIAQRLGMAVGTVKIHMTAILRALEVKNRTQAVLAAMAMGFGRDRGQVAQAA